MPSPASLLTRFNSRHHSSENAAAVRLVVKRDGSKVPWDTLKIIRAVALAFYDVKHESAPNPFRDDPALHYGLDLETFLKVMAISGRVARTVELIYRQGRHPTIEQIQDTVEKTIAAEGEWVVARSYIVYRLRQATQRLQHYTHNGLADYIACAKYARHRADLGRRELFPEAVARVQAMHTSFFGDRLGRRITGDVAATPADPQDRRLLADWIADATVGELIQRAFAAVAEKRVLPSMRSLQFGGPAILRNHARLFNCSFSVADRVEFFREYYFLLLAGTGCGFSVQRHHVARLPLLPARSEEIDLPVVHHTVADTIEGWADACAAAPSLNDGRRWETDLPLRTGMQRIRDAVDQAFVAYADNRLTSAETKALSATVQENVNYLIANCKLPPKVDAMLHVLITELLSAAAHVGEKHADREGWERMGQALRRYSEYFDHPGWVAFDAKNDPRKDSRI